MQFGDSNPDNISFVQEITAMGHFNNMHGFTWRIL
jgi:hypothetical protein